MNDGFLTDQWKRNEEKGGRTKQTFPPMPEFERTALIHNEDETMRQRSDGTVRSGPDEDSQLLRLEPHLEAVSLWHFQSSELSAVADFARTLRPGDGEMLLGMLALRQALDADTTLQAPPAALKAGATSQMPRPELESLLWRWLLEFAAKHQRFDRDLWKAFVAEAAMLLNEAA
jgi:hypothetical protein